MAAEALRTHRKRQLEEKPSLGSLWQENGLVFPSQVGPPLGGRNLIRHYKIRLKRAGLSPTFHFHDLRHACATLLLNQGVHVKYGATGFSMCLHVAEPVSLSPNLTMDVA
jgi:integrase